MKKIINMNLSILLAFVLASGIFTMSGSVYAQGNEHGDQNKNENDDTNNGNIDVTVSR
ncbi:hypothetical protein [Candidatus Nitrosocosmicus hydrocola]|jgi:hypothetical protein|uniref:hypothetical protein n=1 Tax=Candidatus Nitrosocosmicus hydrocola TaxID=1826872 RepID=UPI0013735974|nr:hypothetical protein [Candidatus Nitrosocosmicus hydrocola]